MITRKDIYTLQSERGLLDGKVIASETTYAEYLAQCQSYVTESLSKEGGGLTADQRESLIQQLISRFMEQHQLEVRGYDSVSELYEDLVDSITGIPVIKEPLYDPTVDEIQINDKNTIFIVKAGVGTVPFVDSRGRFPTFATDDEVKTLIANLLNDGSGNVPQFTEGAPILHGKTAQHGYRVNAVHPSITGKDLHPHNFPVTSVVIRKFKEVRLTMDDLVRFQTLTAKMGRFINLIGASNNRYYFVGETGSGKTTTLNIAVNETSADTRVVLVQNPTEVTMFDRDSSGRNRRNVLHMEVNEFQTDGIGSMENLVSNTLRQTPDLIVVGESKDTADFVQLSRVSKMGIRTASTLHSDSARATLDRIAIELSSASNISYSDALCLASTNVDIVIAQQKYGPKRHIKEISEILGYDEDNKPIINTLFEYDFARESKIDENGNEYLEGIFRQVGVISDKTINKCLEALIPYSRIEEFTRMDMVEERVKVPLTTEGGV